MLACAGDGSKLRPMVIFKRKTLPKVANKHGVVIAAQEKGWMDIYRRNETMDRQGLVCTARWTGATEKPACF